MNQTTNLIQFKNLTDEQKAGFDWNYTYECQGTGGDWYSEDIDLDPHTVYRLVIQPDKWYFIEHSGGDVEMIIGEDLLEDDYRNVHSVIRPATAAEIPKPKRVFKDGAFYPVMYRDGEFDVAQRTDKGTFDTVHYTRCPLAAFDWIGEELNINWGES